jgi:hypothetical protein
MNEHDELGRRIASLLDDSADAVGPAQRERLRAARKLALDRHFEQRKRTWAPAFATGIGSLTERPVFGIQYLIPMAALVLGLAGVAYMHYTPSSDIADIDAGLLTDDLPINAYLDQGFDSWLKRSSR